MFTCQCGGMAFRVQFEYEEPLTISKVLYLHCENIKCKRVHRVTTAAEWTKDFPQKSMRAEDKRRKMERMNVS